MKIDINQLKTLKEQYDNAKHSPDANYAAGKVMGLLGDIIEELERKK